MQTVKEVSRRTGVSVRTLHHYDAIGLLKPAEVTAAGYRLYDDAALQRLQYILLFRELQFPLKEIKTILENPDFIPSEALEQQIRLLELQVGHLDRLLAFARELQRKGVIPMSFSAFDKKDIDQYKDEVKERWGNTKAYREYLERKSNDPGIDDASAQLLSIFSELGGLRHLSADDARVQEMVISLQNLITEKYYTCTPEILHGLGRMYVDDERFKHNIDEAGGVGTAEFVKQAIEIHCSGKTGKSRG